MLILRKEAEEDIRTAYYEWYEQQKAQLGRAFAQRQYLRTYRRNQKLLRNASSRSAALCKKFPYAVYFTRKNLDIIVLAVLHQRAASQ